MRLFGYKAINKKAMETDAVLIRLSESSIDCTPEEFEKIYSFFKDIHKRVQKSRSLSDELVFELQTYSHDSNNPNIIVVIRSQQIKQREQMNTAYTDYNDTEDGSLG